MIQTLMASCHRFSRGMKCGSTILTLNPHGNWNGVTQHPKQRKKFKNALSAGKIVAAVCWDEKCVTVLNFLVRGAAVNCYCSMEVLRVLEAQSHQVHQTNVRSVVVQYDDAKPYPSLHTIETITKFG